MGILYHVGRGFTREGGNTDLSRCDKSVFKGLGVRDWGLGARG